MEYFFFGRLKDAPQVRIGTQLGGFTNLEECIKFCRSIMFEFAIYHYESGRRVYDYDDGQKLTY